MSDRPTVSIPKHFDTLDSIEEEQEDDENSVLTPNSIVKSDLVLESTLENVKKSSLEIFSETEEYRNLMRKMNTSLWEYVQQNDEESVEKVLDKEKYSHFTADPNAKGLNEWTAVHMASAYGYKKILKIIINSCKADLNARTSIARTPLHLATIHNHLKVVKLLVASGADVNLKDLENNTALHYASMQGYVDIVEWLLVKAPLFLMNSFGRTPFCLALNYETYAVFDDYSKTKKVPVLRTEYSRNTLGRTLLHNSREDYVNKILAKLSQKVNDKDVKTFNERPRLVFRQKSRKAFDFIDMPPSKVGPKDFSGILQLGRGSFGEVYLVEKIDTKEQFALKVLKKEKVLGSNLVRYAFTERNILLHITHPFIVKLNYAFQTPERLVMVMDFCPNGDLGTHLTREKKFSEEKAKFYMAEIALALGELHKNGILFRDLKPENVVLDKDGHARLTDFGLSKEGVSDEQLSKSFCGSIAYLAPEMLKRAGHTRSVDWYLLGVLTFEMVTGSPPFYSPNREQMFSNIQKAELKFPPFLSEDCKLIIRELMNRDVHKRLGASKKDVEELKEHRFFSDINFDDILNKDIPPPPFKPIRRVMKQVSSEKMFGKLEAETSQKVDGWSVLQPSK
jgi:hypothetical protein